MAEDPSPTRKPLYVFSGGFLTGKRIRRILSLAGWQVRIGAPGADDWIGVWGRTPISERGRAIADRRDAAILTVEDAFLRSLFPGRSGEPPIGLLLDRRGVHFDPATPSDLETLLASHPLDDAALLDCARAAMARMQSAHLTKYSAVDPDIQPPEPGYVLVVDQTRDDASVLASGGSDASFREMLVFAQEEHPGARVLIKTHPESMAGHRNGYFDSDDETDRVTLYSEPISPWCLLEGAVGVYTLSSTLGFEAILAGHKPRVFGQPFYAGWGLTLDERPVARRERHLTRAQLFAAAMILYPTWFDPYRDRLGTLEDVLGALEAEARCWRDDRAGYIASGMRLWKRGHLKAAFGRHKKLIFKGNPETARTTADGTNRPLMVWAGKVTPAHGENVVRVEDGILRSKGLGAKLTPPLSLVRDDLGIYYDPSRPSRLDHLIAETATLDEAARARAEQLIQKLVASGLTKYNVGSASAPNLPSGRNILVPGQVEDDASVRLGCSDVATNAQLISFVRAKNPDAIIVYKPHPDVEAGLRRGSVPEKILALADHVLTDTSAHSALGSVDEVWTMTSTIGFEALLRGLPVTCLGMPFYAGWGLTNDLAPAPNWRRARPDLIGLAYAVLIAYPRYFDPVTGLPCPPEIAVERIVSGGLPRLGPGHRIWAKLQGLKATLPSTGI